MPELYYGAYEFDVCGKYIYHDAKNPIYVFIVDTSIEAFKNKLFDQALYVISNSLDSIPNPENTQICILTVDMYVNCYTVSEDMSKGLKMHQVSDIGDPFLPLPIETLMMNLVNDREKIDFMIEKLSEVHYNEEIKYKLSTLNLSSALTIAYEMLEPSGGRVLAFYSKIENCGPGINKLNENHKSYNTDAEKEMFKPNLDYYNTLAKKMFEKRITVDMF